MARTDNVRRVPRISKVHIDETRARIAAHNLITRLQRFALGNVVMETTHRGDVVETRMMVEDEFGTRRPAMTKEQVAAATKLLSYVLPTLQSVEVKTDETRTYVLRAPLPAQDAETWLKQYGPKTITGETLKPSGQPSPDPKLPS